MPVNCCNHEPLCQRGLRRLVSTRAEQLCEYCLIAIADTFLGGEVDHIVSVKHGGATEAENLAYTCQPCNRNKGKGAR